MTPFSGVLISWLMLARKSVLALLAALACSSAASSLAAWAFISIKVARSAAGAVFFEIRDTGVGFGQAFGEPRLLAADGLRIVAAADADAKGVGQLRALLEEVGGAGVDFRIAGVPHHVATLGVEEDDAFRQGVHRLAQAALGGPRPGADEGELADRA